MHSWGGCRRAHEQRDQILRRAELVVQVAVVKEPGSAQWDETTNLAQLIEDTAHARGIVEIVDGVRVREMVVAPLYDLARLDHPAARDSPITRAASCSSASAWRSSPGKQGTSATSAVSPGGAIALDRLRGSWTRETHRPGSGK